ncbi:MAG: 2-hydroxyacid dehydrogenase [Nitrososphaeria archaeon]
MARIVISFRFFDEWVSYLRGLGHDVVYWRDASPPSKEWLIENLADAEGLLCSLVNRIDSEVIDSARRLRVISTYSVGYDHIDVERARERGIRIGYTPEVLVDATADLIMGLLIAVARRIAEGDRMIRGGKWNQPWTPDFMLGTEVTGKTLGIVGMGRIGRAVAERARGFRMRILYYSRTRKDVDYEFVPLDRLLSESDFVVITVDLNKSTYHMVNYEFLSRMKRTAFLINASRGKVVDERALVRALSEGVIGGAALDVFEQEPLSQDSPLLRLDNVVLTPHLGSATHETRRRMAEAAVQNLLAGLEGREMPYELR